MDKHWRTLGGVCIMIMIVFGSAWWWNEIQTIDQQRAFFMRALEGEILVNGVNVDTDLETLRLEYYVLQQRKDPLYALPGVDLDLFEASLRELAISRDQAAAPYEPDAAKLIAEYLYPLDFLQELAELERLRRSLVSNPSLEIVGAYQEQLEVTILAQAQYVTAFKAVLDQTIEDTLREQTVRFHGGYSNVAYLLRVYDDLLAQIETQQLAAKRRQQCFSGDGAACDPIIAPGVPMRSGLVNSDVAELNEIIAENYELMSRLRTAPLKGEAHTKPIAVLGTSTCIPSFAPAYYYLWWQDSVGGPRIFRPDLLNEIIMYDYVNGEQSQWSYAQKLVARGGGPFKHQEIANHYVCPDLASDFARLQSMRFVFERSTSVSYDGNDEAILTHVKKVNDARLALESQTLLTEFTVYQYVEAVENLLKVYPPQQLADYLSVSTVLDLESLLLTFKLGTYGYDELVMSAVENNSAVLQYAYHGTYTSLGELFFIRSFPKLLLSTFNPSIIPVGPSFVEESATDLPEKVVRYQAVADRYTFGEWIELLQRSRWIDIELGREAGVEYATTE